MGNIYRSLVLSQLRDFRRFRKALLMEMLKEFKSWLREPHSLRQVFAFDVADMTSECSRSDENLVVAVVERDHISTEEWIIQRGQEEERLRNRVHSISHI